MTEVRKATSLRSLKQLNLNQKTALMIRKQSAPLSQLVIEGRHIAYNSIKYSASAKYKRWQLEFVRALDEAGFIRHDIDARSLRIGRLYRLIYPEFKNEIISLFAQIKTNEQYEAFRPITDEQHEAVKWAVQRILYGNLLKITQMRFGLTEDGDHWSLNNTACDLGLKRGLTHALEEKAIEQLKRQRQSMPRIFPCLEPETEGRDIGFLGLSALTYNRLKGAGIDTVPDILNYPKEGWSQIYHMGPKGLREIEDKLQDLGFSNFHLLS